MHLSQLGPASELTMSFLLEKRSGEINKVKRCKGADETEGGRKHGERAQQMITMRRKSETERAQ